MDRITLVLDSGCEFHLVSDHSADSLVEQRGVGTKNHYLAEWSVLFWLCARVIWEQRTEQGTAWGKAEQEASFERVLMHRLTLPGLGWRSSPGGVP